MLLFACLTDSFCPYSSVRVSFSSHLLFPATISSWDICVATRDIIANLNFMTNTKQPSNLMKTLIVAGFIALIALLVWLAVTLVAVLPSAFSSLASLAESVQQGRPHNTITVANGNSIVNNQESFTISWTDVNRSGVYTFAYECTDGVAIDMRYPANNITTVPCGETIKLGGAVTSLELIAHSERTRFIDVDYQIGFIPNGEDVVAFGAETSFTVVNVNIPQGQTVPEQTDDSENEVVEDISNESDPSTPTKPTAPAPQEPTYITTEIYELPSSDPNGFVDLGVTYLGVGRLTDNNQFIPGTVIDSDTRGAFQFEVRNLGTKTSQEWTFTADLPTGREYESDEQSELLPNEYSIITLGFDTNGDTGIRSFGAEIDVDNDRVSSNNTFDWAVTIID